MCRSWEYAASSVSLAKCERAVPARSLVLSLKILRLLAFTWNLPNACFICYKSNEMLQ
jgi:hypothetical protein